MILAYFQDKNDVASQRPSYQGSFCSHCSSEAEDFILLHPEDYSAGNHSESPHLGDDGGGGVFELRTEKYRVGAGEAGLQERLV